MDLNQQIINKILLAKNCVITSHKSPDGDSIGSSLALYRFIKKLNIPVSICHPDVAPDFLFWLDGINEIVTHDVDPMVVKTKIADADLIFSLDYNSLSRVGSEMELLLKEANADFIMIDHHLDPDDFATIKISKPEVCSTAELIFDLIVNSDESDKMDAFIAEPIYLGMMTDTGSFRFSSVTSHTHRVVAEMLDLGLNHTQIHENVFDSNTLDKLRLRGFATSEKLEIVNGNVAIISLTEAELSKFNYVKGDTEGLVNIALSINGVEAAIFLKEDQGKIKMSFRAKGNKVVNVIANEHFEGGGHKYAAGGISFESMDATVEKVKSLIPNYF